MDFPFLWGAATSSHQIEGGNIHNDWWEWEQQGKIKEPSGAACDHYCRFEEDIRMIAALGHNAHRFSLEWSRLEPEEGRWNQEAFDHYTQVFKTLRHDQIEPVVTLHHFTNPVWFARQGGWAGENAVYYFSRYVRKAVEAFGPYVRFWLTINEPMVYIYYGYYTGEWPPGVRSFQDSLKVVRNFLRTHAVCYDVIHRYYDQELKKPVGVSMAKHLTWFSPCRKASIADRVTVFMRNWFVNDLFIQSLQSGFLFFPGIFCEYLPRARTLDFLGVNYYTRDFIRFSLSEIFGQVCKKSHHPKEIAELNEMGWEVHAGGLYHLLMRLKKYRLPIMITENGICSAEDTQRQRFIRDHLGSVARASREGAPVQGYFYWSLMDNFEWAHGFGPRFGIVGVDYQTQKRNIRESAQTLSQSCRKLFAGRNPDAKRSL